MPAKQKMIQILLHTVRIFTSDFFIHFFSAFNGCVIDRKTKLSKVLAFDYYSSLILQIDYKSSSSKGTEIAVIKNGKREIVRGN
jgi:hypothetical protein